MFFCSPAVLREQYIWSLLQTCQLMCSFVAWGDSQQEETPNKFFSYPRVRKFLASKRIDWRFNVDRALWWGSFFERLIQNQKRCLRKTLRNAKLNYDELHTVLVKVEETLNFRSLTYVSSDDPEEPLTPSHLMHGRRILSLPEVIWNWQASLDHTVSSKVSQEDGRSWDCY